jgi:hypothetical protein
MGAVTLVDAKPASATVAPGTTVLVADPASPPAICPGADALGASRDARYILYEDGCGTLIRHDRSTGADLDATTTAGGTHFASFASNARISDDASVVAYETPPNQGVAQLAVHNLTADTLTIASSASNGSPGNGNSESYVLSANGQWLLFSSVSSNLLSGVTPGGSGQMPNIYRKNLVSGAVDLAVPTSGEPDGTLVPGGISDDGAKITFEGNATNIVAAPANTNVQWVSYVRNLTTGTVEPLTLSVSSPFVETLNGTTPKLSADGLTTAFTTGGGYAGIGYIVMCGLDAAGIPQTCVPVTSGASYFDLHLATGGTAIEYSAGNTPDASNWQVYRADLATGTTGVASVNNAGQVADPYTGNFGGIQGISGDGSTVFFSSFATNLDPGATDGRLHVFLRIVAPSTPTPTLTLTPASATSPINTTDVLTAQLSSNGSPVSGSTVDFSVTNGPCSGRTATGTTDSTGSASWSYACNLTGTDTITATASVPDGTGGSVSASATTTIAWTMPSLSYVALGDSYSSGEGTGDYYPDSNNPATFNTCHRSPHAYGPLVDAQANLGPMVFGACSGAVTDDMYVNNPSNPNEPPQLARLGTATRIVTLTLGGNDGAFPHVINKCVDGFRGFGIPTEDQGAYGCSELSGLKSDITGRLTLLGGGTTGQILVTRTIHSLSDVYARIHRAAPNAKIYVGGYPHLFGSEQRSYGKSRTAPSGYSCLVGRVPSGPGTGLRFAVDYRDAIWLNGLADRLNGVIQQQIAVASAAGVPVYYVQPKFDKHGLCDAKQAWINPLLIVKGASGDLGPSAGSFHPTGVGQAQGYKVSFLAKIS